MPETKTRYDHVKVFRPSGTKYVRVVQLLGQSAQRITLPLTASYAVNEATRQAFHLFIEEFGRMPSVDKVVMETVFTTCEVVVTLYEIE